MKWTCLVLLVVKMGAARAGLEYPTDDSLVRDLYRAVDLGNYDIAVPKTLLIKQTQNDAVIDRVVTKLIQMKKTNTIAYAYKLWTNEETKRIVDQHFPVQFQLLFNQSCVEVMNKLYKTHLGVVAPRDINTNRTLLTAFQMLPGWAINEVYFKIMNVDCKAYSFSNSYTHSISSSRDSDTVSHDWYLRPVKYESDLVFMIYNRVTNNAMGLRDPDGDSVDDKQQVSRENVQDRPDLYGWVITPCSYVPITFDCWN